MSLKSAQSSGRITVIASVLMVTILGSIHAFSIFVPEWESRLDTGRAEVSLIYSVALVFLTLAVLTGYRVYRVWSAAKIFALVGTVAGMGLALSGLFASLPALLLFYGVLFGAANGLGYGYALQLSAQATPEHPGVSMCLVTAFYAVGATLSPFLFSSLIQIGGNGLALYAAGIIVFLVSVISVCLVLWAKPDFKSENPSSLIALSAELRRARWLFWIGYGASVASGLMVIGHAFNVADWLGFENTEATFATVIVALGNMLGGFSAAYFSDRIDKRKLLLFLPVITTLGVVALTTPSASTVAIGLFSLGLVGYSYGALIAVYPVAISEQFGALSSPRVYGQVFTAWGIAGLLAPWLSGFLFDRTDSYLSALMIAVACNVLAIVVVHSALPKPQTSR
ncbi:MAG: MFS transporter [Acidiferrobacterales bacterium]|nr:MFS transporter [Acidiferrobacterales bacterium]